MVSHRTSRGRPSPLGATVADNGINFALVSTRASVVYLELFDEPDRSASATLRLDPDDNRTGDVWHIFVHDAGDHQLYGYRVDGPYSPVENGDRFNVNKLLTDPYAHAFAGRINTGHDALFGYDRHSDRRDLSFSEIDSAPHVSKCIALRSEPFDWENSRPPRVPLEHSLIYEVHIRGFTAHPSSAVTSPGTFAGLIDKIPHLVEQGVTAVELMPIQEFDRNEAAGVDPVTGKHLCNYWGYSTLGFFAPEHDYAAADHRAGGVNEFRDMVKRLHQVGIEVIMDVVFNHTGEGDQRGPTLNFRGLDNAVYYMLRDQRFYENYSGCGNTLNCNHPIVKRMIIDALHYWVVEMGVDGFRFDLATILGRNQSGKWIGDAASLIGDIGGDPVLRGSKLIAESWDAAGLYKVGGFPRGWAEWNGRFRDDVRRFVRGDRGMSLEMARRIGGSPDLFTSRQRPDKSINFVTCHDGFTLRDMVSYKVKHNARNGEQGRDGMDENLSDNHGVEGPSDDPAINRIRLRQAKNLLVGLMVARGTPMILGGDELWRTQLGNNNAYSQDNPVSWFDWSPSPQRDEMGRFAAELARFRRSQPALRRPMFADPEQPEQGDIYWHGVNLGEPDFGHHSQSIAFHIAGAAPPLAPDSAGQEIYVAFNAWEDPLFFQLPGGLEWHRFCDTSLPSPADISTDGPAVVVGRFMLPPNSAVILVADSA
ncbi:MAG: isoamylase [Myxococcota bacterium]